MSAVTDQLEDDLADLEALIAEAERQRMRQRGLLARRRKLPITAVRSDVFAMQKVATLRRRANVVRWRLARARQEAA